MKHNNRKHVGNQRGGTLWKFQIKRNYENIDGKQIRTYSEVTSFYVIDRPNSLGNGLRFTS